MRRLPGDRRSFLDIAEASAVKAAVYLIHVFTGPNWKQTSENGGFNCWGASP